MRTPLLLADFTHTRVCHRLDRPEKDAALAESSKSRESATFVPMATAQDVADAGEVRYSPQFHGYPLVSLEKYNLFVESRRRKY